MIIVPSNITIVATHFIRNQHSTWLSTVLLAIAGPPRTSRPAGQMNYKTEVRTGRVDCFGLWGMCGDAKDIVETFTGKVASASISCHQVWSNLTVLKQIAGFIHNK